LGIILAVVTYGLKDMGRMIAQPATRALQADIAPTRIRGRLIATIQAISNVGATVGPVLGGLIWDITFRRNFDLGLIVIPGYSIPFIFSAFMGIIAALLVHRFVHESKGKTTRSRHVVRNP
jgi:MFS family permease